MIIRVNVNATHKGMPAEAKLEMEMSPQEFIVYVKEVLPLVKKKMKK